MYGIQFIEADNSLICGSAEFVVQRRAGRNDIYRLGMRPDGWDFEKRDVPAKKWVSIVRGPSDRVIPEVEKVLPSDFDYKWNWTSFVLALTFFGEGVVEGVRQTQVGHVI